MIYVAFQKEKGKLYGLDYIQNLEDQQNKDLCYQQMTFIILTCLLNV